MINLIRRKWCQAFGTLPLLASLGACAQSRPTPPVRQWSEEEQRRMHRFRGVEGYELYISGFGGNAKEGIYARIINSLGKPMDSGYFWTSGDSKSTGSLAVPESLKFVRIEAAERLDGNLLYDTDVPVADRIPDDLLDELRQRGGMLRIKIRLHREWVLLGWDIQRRPGFDPKKRDKWGEAVYVGPVHSFAGGNFREAEIFNGQVVRKGWYIHPKTGQKIETDF